MSEDKTKLLNLMRFWLFGTFIIVWSAITLYIGLFTDQNWIWALRAGLPIWGTVGVICIVFYYGYKMFQGRKSE